MELYFIEALLGRLVTGSRRRGNRLAAEAQRFRDREPARGVLACPCIELVLECPSLFGFEVDGREKLPEEP